MNVEGFFLDDFKLINDDGHTKTFMHKKSKILFVKQWLDLVPNESIDVLDEATERMYYELNPNILIKTIINKNYIEMPLVEYSLLRAKQLYNMLDIPKCATILTGMTVLIENK